MLCLNHRDELDRSTLDLTVAEKGHSKFQSCIFPNLIISQVVDFQSYIFLEIIYMYHDPHRNSGGGRARPGSGRGPLAALRLLT